MSTRAKFLFDTDFDAMTETAEAAAPAPTFDAEELAAAREEGTQEGIRVGMERARAERETLAADALRTVAERLSEAAAEQRRLAAELRADAARLALAIAGKLAPELIGRLPLVEIEALLQTCLAEMPAEPRVVVRVSDALLDDLRERLDGIAAQCGFEGRFVLVGEPGVAIGDCRIEWADGGAERDSAALMANIEAAIARFVDTVSAENPGGPAAGG